MTDQRHSPRRILFALASPEYLRYYDSTLRLLADRGHTVLVAVNQLRERKQARLHLLDDERVTVVGVVPQREDVWQNFARGVRGTIDFVRYLDPRFAGTPLLRDRMYRKYLPALMRPLNRIRSLNQAWLDRTIGLLQAAERAVPVSRRLTEFLVEHRPDVVVVSPLIDAASDQVDLLRAAQSIGLPVVAAIASWDNLTNKGLMRVEPDRVTVWNEHQKAEAVAFHGVRAERVVVTGAQPFDRWFERTVSKGRREFCAAVGLPDERPFVLFTGSSVFIARSEFEVPFVRQWIEALRASADPALRDLAVLVRPHPFNPEAWVTADFSDLGPVAIWPRRRYTPAAEEARDSFFDSLWHADAVVGINTSAMIEAAILRKPVLSLLTPQFAGTQEGTMHFRYLLPEHGGFLRVANSIEAHVEQLREVLANPETIRQQTEDFVGRFLRPNGLSQPCTPLLADAIQAACVRRSMEPDRLGARVLRMLLWPVVFAADWLVRHGERFRPANWVRARKRRPRKRGVAEMLLAIPERSVRRALRGLRALQKRGRTALKRVRALQKAALKRAWRTAMGLASQIAQMARRVRRLPWRVLLSLRALARSGTRFVSRAVRQARYAFGVWRRGGPPALPRPAAPQGPERSLRVLFAIRSFLFLRLFDPVIRELAARGHEVHLLADYEERFSTDEERRAVGLLESEFPNVSHSVAPRDIEDDWVDLRLYVRFGLDYLRYLDAAYRDSPILAARAVGRTPKDLIEWSKRPFWRTRLGRWVMAAGLRAVERAVPADAVLERSLLSHQADVLLVTPLVWLGSEQQDMIRVARRHGLPSAFCVASWDNLSSKAHVRTVPDRVFVWNETQRDEAVRFHHVPPHRVVVTGAQCFDRWFGRSPARDRETFCLRIGLDPTLPIVVYTCSALFEGTLEEAPFAVRWVEAVRAHHDPVLRHANILIRPHPKRGGEWRDVDSTTLHGAVVWPPQGATPLDSDTRAEYFDSLYHAAAVVGLNTTAMIEAGVIGRPVHTVLLPEFRDNQEGTLHFPYLLDGGLVVAARDLDTHLEQLAASLVPGADHPHLRAFVARFVRPLGLDAAATPFFVGEVEALGMGPRLAQHDPLWTRAVRRLLEPRVLAMTGTFAVKEARERRRLSAARERAQRTEEHLREKERVLIERQAQRDANRAALEAERQRARAERDGERAAKQADKVREREAARAAAAANLVAQRAAREAEKLREREASRAVALAARAERDAGKAQQRETERAAKVASRDARRASHRAEKARLRETGRSAAAPGESS